MRGRTTFEKATCQQCLLVFFSSFRLMWHTIPRRFCRSCCGRAARRWPAKRSRLSGSPTCWFRSKSCRTSATSRTLSNTTWYVGGAFAGSCTCHCVCCDCVDVKTRHHPIPNPNPKNSQRIESSWSRWPTYSSEQFWFCLAIATKKKSCACAKSACDVVTARFFVPSQIVLTQLCLVVVALLNHRLPT